MNYAFIILVYTCMCMWFVFVAWVCALVCVTVWIDFWFRVDVEKENILKWSSHCPYSRSCTMWVVSVFLWEITWIFLDCAVCLQELKPGLLNPTLRGSTKHKADTRDHHLAENRLLLSILFQCIRVCVSEREKYCVYYCVPTYICLLYKLIAAMKACFISQLFLNLLI